MPGALYSDKDGVATEASQKLFSNKAAKISLMVSLVLGLVASTMVYAVEGAGWPKESHIGISTVAVYFALIVQSIVTCFKRGSSFPVGYAIAGICTQGAMVGWVAFREISRLVTGSPYLAAAHPHYSDGQKLAQAVAFWGVYATYLVAPLVGFFAYLCLVRAPDVYYKEMVVDRQKRVSLLRMLTFGWASDLMAITQTRPLEVPDLPSLGFDNRSRNIQEAYLARNLKGRLWLRLVRAHLGRLAMQWFLEAVLSTLTIFPQFAMIHLLQLLEDTQTSISDGKMILYQSLAWTVGLGLALTVQVFFFAWQSWYTESKLANPLYSLLSTMVFDKAVRLYDTATPPEIEKKKGADGEEKKPVKPPSVVNHMKVDSLRATLFARVNSEFCAAIFKLFTGGGLLLQLIGWKSVFAGFSISLIAVPATQWLTNRYSKIMFGMMTYQDDRSNTLLEITGSMRQIKFCGLEKHFADILLKARKEELSKLRTLFIYIAFMIITMRLGPFIFTVISLGVYAYTTDGQIRPSVIFPAIGLFNRIYESFEFLPIAYTWAAEAYAATNRLEKFFNRSEIEDSTTPGETIALRNVTASWPKADAEGTESPAEDRGVLKNVSLEFPSEQLSVITGKTGSGKSLLLATLLGEVKLVSGTIQVPRCSSPYKMDGALEMIPEDAWVIPAAIAFVSQSPWIEEGTLKGNILFGLPYNKARYDSVVKACALEKDIELLVKGEDTEVGPKGVTLSGGQRWRIALARALYSRAGILILDDVLSAVDTHVGKWLVDHALTGKLTTGRTRILATHHDSLLKGKATFFINMKNCEVDRADVAELEEPAGSSSEEELDVAVVEAVQSEVQPTGAGAKVVEETDKEGSAEGRVPFHVYWAYFKASDGWKRWIPAILFSILLPTLTAARTWTLKEWTGRLSEPDHNTTTTFASSFVAPEQVAFRPVVAPEAADNTTFYLLIYVGLYLAVTVFNGVTAYYWWTIGLRSSMVLFKRMTYSVLGAPLRWIDMTPSGRIVNRFTTDLVMLDRGFIQMIGNIFQSTWYIVIVLAASVSVSRYVIALAVVLCFFYVRTAIKYISTARDVKRLDALLRSPIYDQFSTVLVGLVTIRAFDRMSWYMDRCFQLVDTRLRAMWYSAYCRRWLETRMGFLGATYVTFVAASIVLGSVDPALAGLTLTFALTFSECIMTMLTHLSEIEVNGNALQRIVEYVEMPTEDSKDEKPAVDPPAAWPTSGALEVENLTVGYADHLPPALSDLTFSIRSGERVGIVGRTGAGKSSLALALFRLLEPRKGSIYIDRLDISKLNRGEIRRRMAIIPQDPFLFSGTLRSNLDFEGTRDDYELLEALRKVQLIKPKSSTADDDTTAVPSKASSQHGGDDDNASSSSSSAAKPKGDETTPLVATPANNDIFSNLSTPIASGGKNLSQGQRQLVCLARALLVQPKMVVLDEATSAVDSDTAATALREALTILPSDSTVLIIAHRLSTVASVDRIIVLSEGKVLEMGSPRELVGKGEGGAFYGLVQQSSEREAVMDTILGEEAKNI